MPYRIDLNDPSDRALDQLVSLGALDVEPMPAGLAALMPDTITPDAVAHALDVPGIRVSHAVGRDEDSVWILSPRATTIAGLSIVPAAASASPGALQLIDSAAFGTGLHPTTALCVEAMRDAMDIVRPARMLDIGTGSGILALAALTMGVSRAVGLDTDAAAIATAGENARINGLSKRLGLILGGVESVRGQWPLIMANVMAAPLIEMAPVIVQRIAHGGRLVLSGIPSGVAADVERAYQRLGLRPAPPYVRAGWTALVFDPSW